MKYNFDQVIERRNTNSVKWDILENENEIAMWVADMDFRSPPEVVTALGDMVSHGVFGYSLISSEFKDAVVNWVRDRHQWQITAEDVLLVPGVVVGFNQAVQAFVKPGESILFQTPAYGPFYGISNNGDVKQVTHALTQNANGEYRIDLASLEEALSQNVRMFVLCNPHNPSGRVFTREELTALAEICIRHDVLICSDEIHSDLVFSGNKHIPIASLSKEVADRTITLIAPSKTFNVAGLGCSEAVITNPELRKEFKAHTRGLVSEVTGMAQTAGMVAYRQGAPWLEALLQYLETNRDVVYDFVKNELPGVSMVKPEGTFLAWLDCRALGLEQPAADFFREKAQVVMNDGVWFGEDGKGFVRLNFGCPRTQLLETLERMKQALSTR